MRRRRRGQDSFEELKTLVRDLGVRLEEPAARKVVAEKRTRLATSIYQFIRVPSGSGIDEYDLQQALSDGNALARLLEDDESRPAIAMLLQTQMGRLADKLDEILLSLPQRHTDPLTSSTRSITREGPSLALAEVADSYGMDAARERRASVGFVILAVLLLAAAAAAAYWIGQMASGADVNRLWAATLGPAVICITAALAAILSFRQSANHRRTSREYIRLQRGFLAIPDYLAPLPAEVQHLIRATMTQSLFPRLIEDDDPVRQTVWPESDVILDAILGKDAEDDATDANA